MEARVVVSRVVVPYAVVQRVVVKVVYEAFKLQHVVVPVTRS